MTSSTNIAVSSAAVAMAAQAESRARDAECAVVLSQADIKTKESRKTYAECVQRMEPDEVNVDPEAARYLAIAFIIVWALTSGHINKYSQNPIETLFMGLFGACCVFVGVAVIIGISYVLYQAIF